MCWLTKFEGICRQLMIWKSAPNAKWTMNVVALIALSNIHWFILSKMCALQVAMPLLFQGHIDLLEDYLSRSREQQAAFVQLVDGLIDDESNIDAVIRCLISYY